MEPADLQRRYDELLAENARLKKLLKLTDAEATPAKPDQTSVFEERPGPVARSSDAGAKVAFYGRLFRSGRDVYAKRWESRRTGRSGWVPAVAGGWRKGMRHENATYLALIAKLNRTRVSIDRRGQRRVPQRTAYRFAIASRDGG